MVFFSHNFHYGTLKKEMYHQPQMTFLLNIGKHCNQKNNANNQTKQKILMFLEKKLKKYS